MKIEKCKLKNGLEGGGSSGDPQVHSLQPAEAGTTSDEAPDYRFISGPAVRPLRLKPRPVPIAVISIVPDGPPIRFRLHGGKHIIREYWGPERIETDWWREAVVTRDYFRVETSTGQRFWLFRQNDGSQWFLHGEFE